MAEQQPSNGDPSRPRRIFDYLNNENEDLPVGCCPLRGIVTPPASQPQQPPKPHPTPPKVTATSLLMSNHTKEEIHPYVRQDLSDSKVKTIDEWVDATLDVPPRRLERWAAQIGEQKWFEDPIIASSLKGYCEAPTEKRRYPHYIALCNRLLELAPGHLEGISEEDPYPIPDVCFADHSAKEVSLIEQHGTKGARRRPDILCTRRSVANTLSKAKGRATWSDILHWAELKFWQYLGEDLENEKESRASETAVSPSVTIEAIAEDVALRDSIPSQPRPQVRLMLFIC